MEHRQLKTFVAVAKALSFTHAATELGYVQSAVTAQVKALERDLGVPLFDRLGRRIALTDAGRELLPHAVEMLDLSGRARATVSGKNRGEVAGAITVGASETLCIYRLPDLFREFRSRFPAVDLRFRPGPYAELKGLVKEGVLDVAFLLEEPVREKNFVAETLIQEPLMLVAPPDHPLSDRFSVALADLSGEPMLLTDPGCSYRRTFERELAKSGVEVRQVLEFDSVEAIKRCVVAGLGVSILPEVTVAGELHRRELVAPRLKGAKLVVDTQVVRHGNRWISPALQAFLETSRQVLGANQPEVAFEKVPPSERNALVNR